MLCRYLCLVWCTKPGGQYLYTVLVRLPPIVDPHVILYSLSSFSNSANLANPAVPSLPVASPPAAQSGAPSSAPTGLGAPPHAPSRRPPSPLSNPPRQPPSLPLKSVAPTTFPPFSNRSSGLLRCRRGEIRRCRGRIWSPCAESKGVVVLMASAHGVRWWAGVAACGERATAEVAHGVRWQGVVACGQPPPPLPPSTPAPTGVSATRS
jgi:hypothetical protein